MMKNTSEYGRGGPVVAGDGKRVPERRTCNIPTLNNKEY
jgi:hypothetical protein